MPAPRARASLPPSPLAFGGRVPLVEVGADLYLTPDAAAALRVVETTIGYVPLTDAYRGRAAQAAVRDPYDRWVAAGRPQPPGKGQRSVYAARPGESWHQGGRAVDVRLGGLGVSFPAFRAAMRAAGWVSVTPDQDGPNVPEAWHHEYRGPWARVVASHGYRDAARVAALDVEPVDALAALEVQGHLARAGYSPGPLDGEPGAKTASALRSSGFAFPSPFEVGHVPPDVLAWARALPNDGARRA